MYIYATHTEHNTNYMIITNLRVSHQNDHIFMLINHPSTKKKTYITIIILKRI